MRSKMLGLAIALSTFGLGVAATTVWIALNTPNVSSPLQATTRALVTDSLVPPTVEVNPTYEDASPCSAPKISDAERTQSIVIAGGVLNGKAISHPAPIYPDIARATRAEGVVVVKVTVDECGNVAWAKAISGHPLLRDAAEQAAYKWRFSPTFLSGKPVAIRGIITFNFLLQ